VSSTTVGAVVGQVQKTTPRSVRTIYSGLFHAEGHHFLYALAVTALHILDARKL